MAKIFWDTNLFIYLFEENPQFAGRVVEISKAMVDRGDRLCTSCLTVGEILTMPTACQRLDLVNRYRSFFQHPNLTVIPFDFPAALHFAKIRQDKTIRPPDAIQLACAANLGVELFITNDERLSKRNIGGIQFITSLDRAPL
jgi:predicted nucleic acid-binding protein